MLATVFSQQICEQQANFRHNIAAVSNEVRKRWRTWCAPGSCGHELMSTHTHTSLPTALSLVCSLRCPLLSHHHSLLPPAWRRPPGPHPPRTSRQPIHSSGANYCQQICSHGEPCAITVVSLTTWLVSSLLSLPSQLFTSSDGGESFVPLRGAQQCHSCGEEVCLSSSRL